jgi:nicotinate (nicotinamide) nucleotide adenylyltransferase
MRLDAVSYILARFAPGEPPRIEFLKKASHQGPLLGVFASSFNPPTLAHLELVGRARQQFTLDEVLVLSGIQNADKSDYECSLIDRVAMMFEAFGGDEAISIGVSSHAFYVDMVEALASLYPPSTDLHFIIGFDTFERVLDRQDRYTARYHRSFGDRAEALSFLLSRSSLIVANRAGSGREAIEKAREEVIPALRSRILLLDFPAALAEQSASEVRENIHANLSIEGLVPPAVERYINERQLYR